MEELGLPEKLFQTGFEPSGRKRINSYFNLRWIEVINQCISKEQHEMLAESQFRQILQMGHHTFSVMFVHQLLSRQLVTSKLYELWWTFAGKPIRYGIGEYALRTGLNCSKPTNTVRGHQKKKGKYKGKYVLPGDGAVWRSLFGSEDKITPEWIITRLSMGERYKDADTRLRLSLLLLVEGVLCPTSGANIVRPEVVELVGDIDAFLKYPWGRESFVLTVRSVKSRTPAQYTNDTTAIQGFAHAMVLVTVCCCPQIVAELGDEELTTEEIVKGVCSSSLKINVVTTRNLELTGQASVRSILCPDHGIERFDDEVDDLSVSHMVSLIKEDFPFEINSWRGGVKESEAKKPNKYYVEECLDCQESTFPPEVESQPTTHAPSVDGGGSTTMDVESVLRLATDAFEERVVSMFSGYTLSVKEHFDQVVSSLKEFVGAEFAELKRMLRHDIADPITTTSTEAKPNDEGINEGGPTNGTRHMEDTQDVSPNGMCLPPTASGERSQDTHVNNVQSLDAEPDEQPQQNITSSDFPNEDTLRDFDGSTYFSPDEVCTELPVFKSPGRFVLNAVEDALTDARLRGELTLKEPMLMNLVPLLEELPRTTDSDLQSDATKVAHRWVKMLGASVAKSQLEVWAFLQFIVAFGLVQRTKQDETLKLASYVAHFRHAPKLFQSLGLSDAIPNFVTQLLDKSIYIPAIRFMFFFNVENKFSPLEFLKEQIINLRRSAKENTRYESQAEANRDGATLREMMELIEDFKLDIDIPVALILKFMAPREIVSSSVPAQSTHMQASETDIQSSGIDPHGLDPSLPTSFGSSPPGSKRPRVDPEGSRPVIRPCFNPPSGFGRF